MYVHHKGGAKIKVDAAKAQKRIEDLLRESSKSERDDSSEDPRGEKNALGK
jgi:hypothetical protein